MYLCSILNEERKKEKTKEMRRPQKNKVEEEEEEEEDHVLSTVVGGPGGPVTPAVGDGVGAVGVALAVEGARVRDLGVPVVVDLPEAAVDGAARVGVGGRAVEVALRVGDGDGRGAVGRRAPGAAPVGRDLAARTSRADHELLQRRRARLVVARSGRLLHVHVIWLKVVLAAQGRVGASRKEGHGGEGFEHGVFSVRSAVEDGKSRRTRKWEGG